MAITIKPDQLTGTIQEILHSMPTKTENIIDEAADVASKKAVKELKATSPQGSTGNYAQGWTKKKEKGKTVVYNKKYSLTHLLENGHDIIRNGVKVGYSEPIKHIKPVEEMVQEEMTEEVERGIDKL